MNQPETRIEIQTNEMIARQSQLSQSYANKNKNSTDKQNMNSTNKNKRNTIEQNFTSYGFYQGNGVQQNNKTRPKTSNIANDTKSKKEKSLLFPSYSKISHNIFNQSQKISAEKIIQLKKSIHRIQASMDIENQHRIIKETLLEFNKNSIDKIENVSKTVNSNQPAAFQVAAASQGNKVGILDKDKQVFWDQEDFQSKILNQVKHIKANDFHFDQEQKIKMEYGIHTTALMLKNYNRKQKNQYEKESLNCFIQDDTEQENHYESYLKFRKKILERQLETQMINKIQRGSQVKIPTNKMQPDRIKAQTEIYQKQRPSTGVGSKARRQTSTFSNLRPITSSHTRFGVNKQSFVERTFDNIQNLQKGKEKQRTQKLFKDLYADYQKYNQCKKGKGQNSNKFIAPPNTNNINQNKVSTKKIITVRNDKNMTSFQQYQRNKGILLGNFGRYLADLSHTNIVKWRVMRSNQDSNPLTTENKRNKSTMVR